MRLPRTHALLVLPALLLLVLLLLLLPEPTSGRAQRRLSQRDAAETPASAAAGREAATVALTSVSAHLLAANNFKGRRTSSSSGNSTATTNSSSTATTNNSGCSNSGGSSSSSSNNRLTTAKNSTTTRGQNNNNTTQTRPVSTTTARRAGALNTRHEVVSLWRSPSFLLRPWRRAHNFSIVFNKIQKCASSTAAGVLRAVAHHRGVHANTRLEAGTNEAGKPVDPLAGLLAGQVLRRLGEPFILASHFAAGQWRVLREMEDDMEYPVFVATWLRDPADRCYSAYYWFDVEVRGVNDTSRNRLFAVRDQQLLACKNFMATKMKKVGGITSLRTNATEAALRQAHRAGVAPGGGGAEAAAARRVLSTHQQTERALGNESSGPATDPKLIAELFHQYHFVGLAERFSESLVVLKWILQCGWKDILHVAAKRWATLDANGDAAHPRLTPKTETNTRVQAFMREEFPKKNRKDYALFAEANRQLDLLIAVIPHFANELDTYEQLQRQVDEKCFTANPRDECECLYRDNGCCLDCVEQVVTAFFTLKHRAQPAN